MKSTEGNKLPQYIQKLIERQNKCVAEAKKLEVEIDNWCDKSGIDIWSEEYKKTKAFLPDAVGAVKKDEISKLYEQNL